MAKEGGQNWYQQIHYEKLPCRHVSFCHFNETVPREEHKIFSSVLTTFSGAMTNWCRKILHIAFPRRYIQNIMFIA
jgi:hypothetical protein